MKWQLLSNDLGVNGYEDHDKPVAKGNLGRAWGPDSSRLGLLHGMVEGALYDAGVWKNLPPDTLGALYTAALAAWNDFNMQYDPADFPRSDERHTYPPEDYEPPHPDRVRRYAWVDQIYYGTRKAYRYLGVDRDMIERTYRWAEKIWPNVDGMSRLESGHAAVGSGAGLRAEVYEGSDVTGEPVDTFVEERLSEKWKAGEGPSSVSNGTYAIRWTGEIQPFFDEKLHLYFLTHGGLRVWLDGEKIIDSWSSDNRRFDHYETDELEKGKRYSIRIEYERKDRSRQPQLKFMWGGALAAPQFLAKAVQHGRTFDAVVSRQLTRAAPCAHHRHRRHGGHWRRPPPADTTSADDPKTFPFGPTNCPNCIVHLA